MTNKQYEHLGRALVCEAKLETMRDELDQMCQELSINLGVLIGNDAAKDWVRKQYGEQFATSLGARDFMVAVRDIIINDEKKERKKNG